MWHGNVKRETFSVKRQTSNVNPESLGGSQFRPGRYCSASGRSARRGSPSSPFCHVKICFDWVIAIKLTSIARDIKI
jgi:hypothetical protein